MGHVNPLAIVLATLVTALLLFAVVLGGARIAAEGKKEFNLLVLTKGPFGRASLSNLQLFYFLVIVIWAVLYAFFAEWSLPALSSDTLALLGIGGAGTAGAKVTATFRRRISSGNWAWLKNKAWIDDAIEKQPPRPTFGDLVSTDGQFDVTKFQSLAFSLIVGISLLRVGITQALPTFALPANYLMLLGLSQLIYVGGKAITPPTHGQLEDEITNLRNLESKFMATVAQAWQQQTPKPASPDLAAAKSVALDDYNAYRNAAAGVAELVADMTGDHKVRDLDPALPRT